MTDVDDKTKAAGSPPPPSDMARRMAETALTTTNTSFYLGSAHQAVRLGDAIPISLLEAARETLARVIDYAVSLDREDAEPSWDVILEPVQGGSDAFVVLKAGGQSVRIGNSLPSADAGKLMQQVADILWVATGRRAMNAAEPDPNRKPWKDGGPETSLRAEEVTKGMVGNCASKKRLSLRDAHDAVMLSYHNANDDLRVLRILRRLSDRAVKHVQDQSAESEAKGRATILAEREVLYRVIGRLGGNEMAWRSASSPSITHVEQEINDLIAKREADRLAAILEARSEEQVDGARNGKNMARNLLIPVTHMLAEAIEAIDSVQVVDAVRLAERALGRLSRVMSTLAK